MPRLRWADERHELAGVRLVTELWKRAPPRPFARAEGGWALALEDLPVDLLAYELELVHADGAVTRALDPDAPVVGGPGGRSLLVLPGYRAPGWLAIDAPPGAVTPLAVPAPSLGGAVEGLLWTAPGLPAGAPAPLLVVHDGPAYLAHAALDRYLAAAVAGGDLPPLRAALLASTDRGADYAASEGYATALASEVVPALEAVAPTPGPGWRAGLGASLGALAMLHAHRRHPGLFAALGLQSGSFFQPALDGHEAWFGGFARIAAFVEEVLAAPAWPAPVEVGLTCGAGEENLANNRAMAAALAAQGYPLRAAEPRDGHTWTCWRDGLEVALGAVARAWRRAAAR